MSENTEISKSIKELEGVLDFLESPDFKQFCSINITPTTVAIKRAVRTLKLVRNTDKWHILAHGDLPKEHEIKKNSEYWHSLKSTYCKDTDDISVSDTVLVSVIGYFNQKPRVDTGRTINGIFHIGLCGSDKVIAWQPLPRPYKSEM